MNGSEKYLLLINENIITEFSIPNDIIDKEEEDKKIKLEENHSYIKGNITNKSLVIINKKNSLKLKRMI